MILQGGDRKAILQVKLPFSFPTEFIKLQIKSNYSTYYKSTKTLVYFQEIELIIQLYYSIL